MSHIKRGPMLLAVVAILLLTTATARADEPDWTLRPEYSKNRSRVRIRIEVEGGTTGSLSVEDPIRNRTQTLGRIGFDSVTYPTDGWLELDTPVPYVLGFRLQDGKAAYDKHIAVGRPGDRDGKVVETGTIRVRNDTGNRTKLEVGVKLNGKKAEQFTVTLPGNQTKTVAVVEKLRPVVGFQTCADAGAVEECVDTSGTVSVSAGLGKILSFTYFHNGRTKKQGGCLSIGADNVISFISGSLCISNQDMALVGAAGGRVPGVTTKATVTLKILEWRD